MVLSVDVDVIEVVCEMVVVDVPVKVDVMVPEVLLVVTDDTVVVVVAVVVREVRVKVRLVKDSEEEVTEDELVAVWVVQKPHVLSHIPAYGEVHAGQ